MDRQTLRDWVIRYNAEGVAGLAAGESGDVSVGVADLRREEFKEAIGGALASIFTGWCRSAIQP